MEDWKIQTNLDRNQPATDDPTFKIKDDLYFKKKDQRLYLWVPYKLRTYVIKAFHDPPVNGHQGVDKTYEKMRDQVYWTNMEQDVRDYIKACEPCQKYKHHRHMSKTQKMPILTNVFQEVSMDVVGPVPSSKMGNRYILATQDRLSRWLMFNPIGDQSAETTVRTFLTKWICVYGVPEKIITDRGSNFVSSLFQELHKFLGIKASNTCAYRPLGNGMNEHSHRCLH